MEELGKPSGLVRRKGSASWYFRQRWPTRLRTDGSPAEIWVSLDTADYREAIDRLDRARSEARKRFECPASSGQPETVSAIHRLTVHPTWPDSSSLALLTYQQALPLAQGFFAGLMREIEAEPLGWTDDRVAQENWRTELEDRLACLSRRETEEEHDPVSGPMIAVLRKAGVRTDHGTEACNLLHNYLRRAMIEATRLRIARLNSDFSLAVNDTIFRMPGVLEAAVDRPASGSAPIGVKSGRLGLIADKYLDGLLRTPRSLKTEDRYRSEMRHIVAFFGAETEVWTIDQGECDRFRNAFALLPPNFEDHIRRGGSIASVVAGHTPSDPVLAWATLNKYLSQLSRFLKWAHDHDYLAKRYGSDLKPLSAKPQGSMAKLPFEDAELRRAFSRPIYTGCRDDSYGFATRGDNIIRRARYWAPLIALFSGLRCSEILQLSPAHFRVSPSGHDFIVLTPDMVLKNENAEREIPIHPALIRIGLIDWVGRRRTDQHGLLFPEVPSHSKYGDRSTRFSKWYASDLKGFELGERRAKLTFHSYRHTFKRALDRADVREDKKDELCGWSRGSKIGRRYGSGLEADVLASSVAAVSFAIDLEHLFRHAELDD